MKTYKLSERGRSSERASERDRSSRPEVFCKKRVLKNFAKFPGKRLRQSLFLNKFAGLRPATWHKFFPVNFVKFLRTPFYRTPLVVAPEEKMLERQVNKIL